MAPTSLNTSRTERISDRAVAALKTGKRLDGCRHPITTVSYPSMNEMSVILQHLAGMVRKTGGV